MKQATVNSITFEKLKELILKGYFKQRVILNFFNSNDLYNFKANKIFQRESAKKNNFNLIDGFMVSLIVKGKRLRGPEFTRRFFEDLELLDNKKHFFIGFEKKDLDLLVKKKSLIKRKNLFCYNPPFIKETEFPKKELDKIIKLVNKQKIDYLWIGVGSPKQTIMANQISDKVKVKIIFTVGAAFDFVTEKKKEAPKVIQKLGIEWLFRLITDFKNSRKKVWRSLLGTLYAPKRLKKRSF